MWVLKTWPAIVGARQDLRGPTCPRVAIFGPVIVPDISLFLAIRGWPYPETAPSDYRQTCARETALPSMIPKIH